MLPSHVVVILALCSIALAYPAKSDHLLLQQQQQQQQQNPNVVYVAQAPPQHYGVLSPFSYNSGYNPSLSTAYNPASYNPSYNPMGPIYNTAAYNPTAYNPSNINYNYNPAYNPPQQFYYNQSPAARYPPPQFVFVYPGYGGLQPNVPQAPPVHSMPTAPPHDETGDAETVTVGVDDSSEREPLSPGVALSGPETGKRVGLPEKHVQTLHRIVQQPALLTKAAVQHRPPVQELRKIAALKIDTDTVPSSSSESETRVAVETEGENLRAQSRGWRRRLAPSLQSVYLDAEDDDDAEEKQKKPGKEEADAVVVGNGDSHSGPSVASVKPAAIALAGPGGVASASPVGTAVVGPGGLAVSAPSATAVAGPSNGVPPGALGGGGASARSNFRIHQILESLYGKPARQAALRTVPSAYYDDELEQ
ncbi:hypothetical protein B566_EDAN006037 [Ephemera danica]|nr:hypothetical protein B566_EDAN006037 [Ephemera danica]